MEENKHIIFHVPLQINRNHASASQIRPIKMLEAFQKKGYHVDVVEGCGRERKRQIKKIKQKICNGIKYDFVYSESSTMPTLLTEKHHLPIFPSLDFHFFRFCKKHSIPIGLFYRDIHWCFINKNKDWKQRIAKFFYRYDLRQYKRLVDVLFLPSMEMLPHIPAHFENTRVTALPPGCEVKQASNSTANDVLNLLYIGGVGGNYDLRILLEAVSQCPFVHLTLCCRVDDWQKIQPPCLSPNITVVHKNSEDIPTLYGNAHLFVLFFQNDYWKFAVPFKLFEAIGYQVPLLAATDTWCGQFINQNEIGYTADFSTASLIEKLQEIHQNPDSLQLKQAQIKAIAQQNSWECRAQKVTDELIKVYHP